MADLKSCELIFCTNGPDRWVLADALFGAHDKLYAIEFRLTPTDPKSEIGRDAMLRLEARQGAGKVSALGTWVSCCLRSISPADSMGMHKLTISTKASPGFPSVLLSGSYHPTTKMGRFQQIRAPRARLDMAGSEESEPEPPQAG